MGENIPYDKVRCEICGKLFTQLGTHLKTHNITADEYKERFPGKPLQSQKIRDLKSKRFSGENNPMYGRVSPFKGRKHSPDSREKIKKARAKQVLDERWYSALLANVVRGEKHWTKNEEMKKKYLYGEKNPFYGKRHTEESKKKMSENNSSKRPENRKKLSEAMKRRLESGWTPPKLYERTKPHMEVIKILDALGIRYIEEKPVSVFRFDIYLPDYSAYIEVNGDYIHGHPKKYKDSELNELQKRRRLNDERKSNIIKNRSLLWLWSSDIRENVDLCVFLIFKLISGEIYRSNSYDWEVVFNG